MGKCLGCNISVGLEEVRSPWFFCYIHDAYCNWTMVDNETYCNETIDEDDEEGDDGKSRGI